jgi:hypothetical protein
VVEVAHTFVEVWEGVASLLGELDVLAGFADLAANAPSPYVRPEVGRRLSGWVGGWWLGGWFKASLVASLHGVLDVATGGLC